MAGAVVAAAVLSVAARARATDRRATVAVPTRPSAPVLAASSGAAAVVVPLSRLSVTAPA